jgi:predicted RNA-binding protein YlxR (DUF448 family)
VKTKTGKRVKHIPQRTCVGCHQVLAKRALIRLVKTSEGLKIDPSGKIAGRGAYLHDRRSCWQQALKGGLAHALKVEFNDQDLEMIRSFAANLSDEKEN